MNQLSFDVEPIQLSFDVEPIDVEKEQGTKQSIEKLSFVGNKEEKETNFLLFFCPFRIHAIQIPSLSIHLPHFNCEEKNCYNSSNS